jgi:hypothetical protein
VYFIRNSDSSATSGDDSSDDSSFDSSGAGAGSAGDSPQGKSDVVQLQSRQDGGFYPYPTRGRAAQNERDRERDEETERGVQCSWGSVWSVHRTTKAKVRCAVTSGNFCDSKSDPAANIGAVG